jgi:hypothetical protein
LNIRGGQIGGVKIMPLPVKLRDVVDGLQMADDTVRVYINRNTGEVAPVTDEQASWAEEGEPDPDWPQWQVEVQADVRRILESEDFMLLPSKFEIHEWSVTEGFAQSLDNEHDRADLLEGLHGRGAFRLFKTMIARMGLREAWFEFRNDALAEIAVDFLEAQKIPYTRD